MWFQLHWKVDIHIFPVIYDIPSNSLIRERTVHLKLSFHSTTKLQK
jgi:hypothetical protein